MPKPIDLTAEQVAAKLAYDPETGIFIWKVAPSRRMPAGSVAGSQKGVRSNSRTGKNTRYTYIRFEKIEAPAARFAWLLTYGKWPEGLILFKDGDPSNLRLENLKEAMFKTKVYTNGDGRRIHRMSLEAQRHYGRKRYYGLTGEEYGAMLAEQKGVCAICEKPETAMLRGTPKQLHVDHCHETNRIRALLCGKCNAMLGLAGDNTGILRAAADYIEKHKASPSLRLVTGSVKKDNKE